MVEMQTRSELSMNDQSGSATSSINAFTSYPLSLRMVGSNTAPSRGIGNLLKICRPGEPASINETLLIIILFQFYSRKPFNATSYRTVGFSTHSLHALRINVRLISRKNPFVISWERGPRRMSAFLRRKDFSVLASNVKMLKILNIHSME